MKKATLHIIILSLALSVALFSCSLAPFAASVSDLGGTEWYLKNKIPFSSDYEDSVFETGFNIDFVSNDTSFSSFAIQCNTQYDFMEIYFDSIPVYAVSSDDDGRGTWHDDSYRTVQVFGGLDSSNPTLVSWFNSYGILVSSSIPTPTPSPTSTPTPTPTSTPIPTPTPTPTPVPVTDYFRPFKSFSGTYFDDTVLAFPDSVTRNKYEQYSGIVSDSNLVINNTSTNLDFYDDKVVYKMEYEFTPLESDIYTLNFLYDAEDWLNYSYVYYTVNGQDYEADFSQIQLNGLYSVYGAYDIDPTTTQGPPWYIWDYTLTNQKSIEVRGLDLQANTPIKISVIVSSSTLPTNPSVFEWEQFFQDTRPDSIFLTTTGGLAALPFFVSGLSFLALGALIGIILKFMR